MPAETRPMLMAGFALLLLGVEPQESARAQSAEHPLEPAVTSSPRETFHTLLVAQEQMWALVRDEGVGTRSEEGFQKLMELDARSKRTLDLTGVAPEARRETANDTVVYLYEVLTRIELPPLEAIPGDAEIEGDFGLNRWTLPHTEITVHRLADGPRQGEYLFSPETVERAEEFYERTRHLPYRVQPPIENVSEFLETYGGWEVPIAWVDALPTGMRRIAWGQALWKWMVLLSAVFVFLGVFFGVLRNSRRKSRPRSAGRYMSRLIAPILLFAGSVFGLPTLSEWILLTGDLAKLVNLAATAIGYLSLAWIVWMLILAAGEALLNRPSIRAHSLDASLIRLTARLIAIAVVVVLVFQGATAIGIPLVGLVAGVSVGGLAVALAAQDTLKSLLGSMTIFIDRPYTVGDRIIAGGYDGVVERIGLRSTGLRQLDGNVTSIPNEKMAAMEIENVERRQTIRRKTRLRIAIGTPRQKVEEALAIVKDILNGHDGMPADQLPRVYFDELNPDSLSIVMFYWYAPPDYWEFCALSERVNLEIIRRFAEAGIELAPPTSETRIVQGRSVGEPTETATPDEAER